MKSEKDEKKVDKKEEEKDNKEKEKENEGLQSVKAAVMMTKTEWKGVGCNNVMNDLTLPRISFIRF